MLGAIAHGCSGASYFVTQQVRRHNLEVAAQDTTMIHKARDLSPDQKTAIESLLGRAIAEDEAISIRTTAGIAAPEWLQASWESARQLGLDNLSPEEIDAEIAAARKARRDRQPVQQ
jgi:hypothetical protein